MCITPSVSTLKDSETYLSYLTSHEWIVDKAEEYGSDGILKRAHCKNCGIERTVIVSEIKESEARARDYRRKLVEERAKSNLRQV